MERADDIALACRSVDDDEVAQGIVWPLLGAENEIDDPSPVSIIRDLLKQAGISDIEIWSELTEPSSAKIVARLCSRTARVKLSMPRCRRTVNAEASHFH